jgi:F-type H+-transporting ATPase subunit a
VSEQEPVKKKRGCLGCSLPIAITITVLALALFIIGFLSGPLGQSFFKGINMPDWLKVPTPSVELPAEVLFHIGSGTPILVFGQQIYPFPVTNTILTTWITLIVLALIFIGLSYRSKIVPGKFQGMVESILEWVYNLCKDVAGEKAGASFFPIIVTIFLLVLFNAWMGLIPGFGSILVHSEEGSFPLLRGANTDINTPLAIALISFVFVTYVGLASGGFRWVKQFVNFGRFFRGWGKVFTGKFKGAFGDIGYGFIDAFVGGLEAISYIFRIFSFTFRLFGNMTGGEILVLMFLFLFPFVIVLPIYGLELLVGAVQALIFAGLTLVFAAIAVMPHEDEGH